MVLEAETMTAPDNHGQESRRGEIVARATELFLSKGYAATSMSALADACGIQKASLYHHFAGKQALFFACVTQGYESSTARLEEISADHQLSAEERFRQAMYENYRTIVDSPIGRMSPLIAQVSLQFPQVARQFHDEFIVRLHELMGVIIDDGVTSGEFGDHDRLGLMHLIFGPIVTLSLSRDMFAQLDTIESTYAVQTTRDSHCALMLELLKTGAKKVR